MNLCLIYEWWKMCFAKCIYLFSRSTSFFNNGIIVLHVLLISNLVFD